MDSLINAAARALAVGDPLGALRRVALRNDAAALALRGIALAQLGDFAKAKLLLRRAARAFGAGESLARARCVLAEVEIALAARELGGSLQTLAAARRTLARHGDHLNAAHARQLLIRRLLLVGQLADAERELAAVERSALSPALRAVHELASATIALRRLQTKSARRALEAAAHAAATAGIPALQAEVRATAQALEIPAAWVAGVPLRLAGVEALLHSGVLVIDATRRAVRQGGVVISLARRPVLFLLARALATAAPHDVPRRQLVKLAFRGRCADESHRARLRVEIGRLRAALRGYVTIYATAAGYRMHARARRVVVLEPPKGAAQAAVLALLADGEAWSSSALALALQVSQRTVQRELESALRRGAVRALGRGRAQRWLAPPWSQITPTLLLPAAFATG
jgi:hypothetical protein